MRAFASLLVGAAALALAGCGASVSGGSCAGWSQLTPNAQTRTFVLKNDRLFANQVAGHNDNGRGNGCWK